MRWALSTPSSYPALIDSLLAGRIVRPRFGRHPRAFIWGPLEARMQHADCMILAGLVEGSWPPEPPGDPWLSRPMRARFGLTTPERRVGLAAHDFVQAASAGRVLLLHSERSGGAPTVPARWLVRLRAMLDAHGLARPAVAGATPWRHWQSMLDRPPAVEPVSAPRPRPPLEARPAGLSVTQVEIWQRDPYAIYARHILGLRPLDEIDEDADAAARGSFVHEALERLVAEFPEKLPPDALERLLAHGRTVLGAMLDRPSVAAFWWPRFERVAAWFVEEERRRRETLSRVLAEQPGHMEIDDGRGGGFTLSAKADRLEVSSDGALRIVDYKTGVAPAKKSVTAGSAPQLPLEAALAEAGAFEAVGAATVTGLEYWTLSGGRPAGSARPATREDPSAVAREALDGLERLVAAFADPETAYLDHPAGAAIGRFDDYLDLARTNEWRLGWRALLDDVSDGGAPERETPRPRGPDTRQQALSDPSRTVWVAASAGAGKTKVLTDRVLRLLLEGHAPSRVLCLTFTRAAAAEMANRVRQELANWSAMDDGDLAADIAALTGSRPGRETVERARRLFAATLEAPGGLQIATIHGFCQSLLGRFPLEADVAPHFEVIEDRARSELLRAARDDAIDAIASGRAPHLRDALDRLAPEAGERRAGNLLGEICAEAGAFDRMLARYGSLDRALDAVAAGLETDPDRSIDDLKADACRDSSLDGPGLRAAVRALDDGGRTDRETAETILAFLDAREEARPALLETYAARFLTKADRTPRKRPVGTGKVREARPDAAAVLDRETERLAALYARIKAKATFERTRAILVLGLELLAAFRARKRDLAVLDYDDLIARARDLLTRPGVSPWVLYKLDGGLDHVLVDEAQDTSPAQWEVILALTEEFFTGEGAREKPRTLFVVGDEKQSIFSFQGADVEALRNVRDGIRERTPAGEWRDGALDLSFRSVPAVLEAVDAVFAAPEAAAGVALDGEAIRHEPFRGDDGGLVEVWPLLEDEPAEEEPDPWTACLDETRPRDRDTRLATAVAAHIAAMTGDDGPGELLASRGDTIRPGDILVLVRRRGELVSALVRELRRKGVAVAGVDRMDLTGEVAVRDLLAIGRVCLLPEDDLSLAAVLKGPFVGFDDDMLFDLAWRGSGEGKARETLWAALRRRKGDSDAFARAADWISALLGVADYLAPFEFFDRILSMPSARAEGFNGRKALIGRLGLEAQDPLDEFLNLALAFERDHVPSLQGFVWWLSSGTAEVKREAETAGDAVRIMTVHGAKGLQAPVVFLADVMGRGPSGPAILWDPRVGLPLWVGRAEERAPWGEALDDRRRRRAAEEERRLLYVALTRARDRLYVCAAAKSADRGVEGSWHDMVRTALSALPGVERIAMDDAGGGPNGEALRLASPQRRPVAARRAGPEDRVPLEGPPPGILGPPPPERPIDKPISPSRFAGGEAAPRSPLDGSDGGAALRRGRLVHRLLELLPDLAPDRRGDAARALVARRDPALPDASADGLIARVLAILDDPAFAAVFAPGGRSEVAIAGVVGETVVSGRVDRLAVSEDKIGVVDFKTGLTVPDRVDDTPAAYLGQLSAYREILRMIYPDRPISCGLLWCDIPELVEIPARLLDTHRPTGRSPRAA